MSRSAVESHYRERCMDGIRYAAQDLAGEKSDLSPGDI